MAKYRTKVTVRTNGKEYKPGTILPDDISTVDLNFLKSKKFVEVVDAAPAVYEDENGDEDEGGSGDGFDGFNEINPGAVKTADEIRKLRSKKDVAAYAASIGLDLGNYDNKALKDLQEEVINYQEEQTGDEGGEE